MTFKLNPLFAIDFYKAGHYAMYPEGIIEKYSNFTPRSSRTEADYIIVAGIQKMIIDLHTSWKENFFDLVEEEIDYILLEYQQFMDSTIYPGAVQTEHIKAVWEIGYLPLHISSIAEGTKVPVGTPIVTIRNTHPDAYWLVNYLESWISNVLWKPITSATTAFQFLETFHVWANETGADKSFIPYQGHDFSYRGMSGLEDAISSGLGHLFCFKGTDTVPAIFAAQHYQYGDWRKEQIGCSVPATEHSVMCAGSKDGEIDTFKSLMDKFPKGPLSVVSDTWDYWKVITQFLPELKDQIMARDGRLIIRPDSGDPVRIICGYEIHTSMSTIRTLYEGEDVVYLDKGRYYLYLWDDKTKWHYSEGVIPKHEAVGTMEMLWETFGGIVNSKGFKSLDTHIGLIYGDSITLDRQHKILQILTEKRFTADNLVLGIGLI